MYTIHLLSVPHAKITKDYVHCAFTQKVLNMSKLIHEYLPDYKVITYGVEGGEPSGEFVQTMTSEEFSRIYPQDTKKDAFDFDNKEGREIFNKRTIEAINARKTGNDLLLMSFGWAHEPIASAVGITAIEMGIGYPSSIKRRHRIFESYAWMYYNYGMEKNNHPSQYDAVIPNYYDLGDFEFFPESDREDPYFFFIGRPNRDKGRGILIDVALTTGYKFKFAGQGQVDIEKQIKEKGAEHLCEHVGWTDHKRRNKLMGNARALCVPTQYVEPFASVQIEGLLSGTPLITSDNGVFNETNKHGLTGFRCRHFQDYVRAVNHIDEIQRPLCRAMASQAYSLERAAKAYGEYFKRIVDLSEGKGWYSKIDVDPSLLFNRGII